ncbi:FecR family protein [Sphingobacterium griseoflavum]|uniref:FecR protein domain-containing protein n=1 Tax=Sphingobacterium griseoflavum TaxID=1474952 RepID=A0ABQ3HS12_9SPHI|nr:FecR domain-containing protein [Sphingobacterium griseoflavum]GHE28599.1 hypothetical protein GCM10017764_08870 [Sphingobacterium griseoflavum]
MKKKKLDQYEEEELRFLWEEEPTADDTLTDKGKQLIWGAIKRATQVSFLRWNALVAASVAVFIALGVAYWRYGQQDSGKMNNLLTVRSGDASKTVMLPDSSTVILSQHSTLRYPESFYGLDRRHVSLAGEAVFRVKHTGQEFVVVSGNVETEVLGTVFKVTARKESAKRQVALYEGKVNVRKRKGQGSLLKPGDLWLFDTATNEVEVRSNSAKRLDLYLTFNNTPLTDAIAQIETLYQIQIVNKLPDSAAIPDISGKFYYSTAQQSLDELAFPFGLTVNQVNEKTYELSKQ